MGLFKNIFKRKPGGTFVGNMIRGAVKNVPVVGGFLGNGQMMISEEDADKRDLSDADFEAKYGKKKDGRPISALPGFVQQVGAVLGSGLPGLGNMEAGPVKYANTNVADNIQAGAQKGISASVKRYGGYIVGGVAMLTLLLVIFLRKKK